MTVLTNLTTNLMAKLLRALLKVPSVLTNVLARVTLCSVGLGVVKGSGLPVDCEGCALIISTDGVGVTVLMNLKVYTIMVTTVC